MSITWKNSKNLKPAVILDRIVSFRTVGPGNRISFSGFGIEDAMPALNSMLNFPPAADNVSRSMLIWKALTSVTEMLTPKIFITAINEVLSTELATREQNFHILTALSIKPDGIPSKIQIENSIIKLVGNTYPTKYSTRNTAIKDLNLPVQETPTDYCRVVVNVVAKSPFGAMTKALRVLDLQRALWCLMCNSHMEIYGQAWNPINKIRLGSIHTIHNPDGSLASEQIWFEPNFAPTKIHQFENINIITQNCRKAFRSLNYGLDRDALPDSLLRYVRALDERDQNTAFLRLWGAVESLASPGFAKYDSLVRRCAFLFRDMEYHRQILEHLREYRNQSVHAGDQSTNAKTYCFQLQYYFSQLIWFHLGSTHFFKSLAEANTFLDLVHDKDSLLRKKQLISKAIRFVS